MSNLKLNRIGFIATGAAVLIIAVVQGCSSSDNQAAPTAGTGGMTSTAGKGGSTSTAGKGGASGGTTSTAGKGGAGGETVAEGGAAGATGGGMCEPAEDHGEAAYLAAHGGKLPTL